jgi:hypothetical protein
VGEIMDAINEKNFQALNLQIQTLNQDKKALQINNQEYSVGIFDKSVRPKISNNKLRIIHTDNRYK